MQSLRKGLLCLLTLVSATMAHAAEKKPQIPENATFAVKPIDGFEYFLIAAIYKRELPITIVRNPATADYVIDGSIDSTRASTAKAFWLGVDAEHLDATLNLTRNSDRTQVWQEKASAALANRGQQSVADSFAKHLSREIEGKQRKPYELVVEPKVYVAVEGEFRLAMLEAWKAKQVPATIVSSREDADYILEGVSRTTKADTRHKVLLLNWQSREQAAIALFDRQGAVRFAYAYYFEQSHHGVKSSAESCAKYLGDQFRSANKHPEP
ncbi:hypothetical protein [Terriglobus tenax]|uniref:hypothetical protein n=1 Tax=Terriglobus tenax TaxID=1111115 RepID=UPI0021E08347|nr:hypothetical protein [Terriglobus tenax]